MKTDEEIKCDGASELRWRRKIDETDIAATINGDATKPALPMTTDILLSFWHQFAARERLDDPRVIARADALIRKEPEYWVDQSMWALYTAACE